jgi:hypothetical protein
MARFGIPDFQLANPIYRGSSVTFYTVNPATRARTTTKATLYEGLTGAGVLTNPQVLDADGKFARPPYVDEAVIGVVDGLHVDDHDTGVIGELLLIEEAQLNVMSAATLATASAKRSRMSELAAQAHRMFAMGAASEAATYARDVRRRVDGMIQAATNTLSGLSAMAADATNRARRYAASALSSANTATTQANTATAAAAAAAAAVQGVMWRDVIYKTTADSPLTLDATYGGKLVVIDATAGAVTVNLPQISAVTLPWSVGIKKADSGGNAITVNRAGSDTIGGATSATISQAGEDGVFVADDSAAPDDWTKIGFYNAPGAASESAAGIVELATQAEVDAETDDTRAVTALKLATRLAAWLTASVLGVAHLWTKPQRTDPVTDNDGSFDMNAANDFICTTSGATQITFTNRTTGHRGMILLTNASNHAVTFGANITKPTGLTTVLSVTGEYMLSYWSPDGTNVKVCATGALS